MGSQEVPAQENSTQARGPPGQAPADVETSLPYKALGYPAKIFPTTSDTGPYTCVAQTRAQLPGPESAGEVSPWTSVSRSGKWQCRPGHGRM